MSGVRGTKQGAVSGGVGLGECSRLRMPNISCSGPNNQFVGKLHKWKMGVKFSQK